MVAGIGLAASGTAGCSLLPQSKRTESYAIGSDPVPADRIYTMAEHSYCLPAWAAFGARGRTVLHIDAHDDLRVTPETHLPALTAAIQDGDADTVAGLMALPGVPGAYTYGNYLYPAVRSGIVDEIVWVVPDELQIGSDALAFWRQRMEKQRYPKDDVASLVTVGDTVAGTMFGVPFTICTASSIPAFDEPVLLDIDMDYFVLPLRANRYTNAAGAVADMIAYLKAAEVKTDCVTLATSVPAEHLPLQYEWMTDLMYLALIQPSVVADPSPPDRFAFAGEAVIADIRGDKDAAMNAWAMMKDVSPEAAAAWFGTGRSKALDGRADDGMADAVKAAELNPSYAYGFVQLAGELGRMGAVEEALGALKLAGDGVHGYLRDMREASIYYNAERYQDALERYRSLTERYEHPDLFFGLGDAYRMLGKQDEAADWYSRGVALFDEHTYRSESDYVDALPTLARLAAEQGDVERAFARYDAYLEALPDGEQAATARTELKGLERRTGR